MKTKSFIDIIDDETLAEMIDITLRHEKRLNYERRTTMRSIIKIIPIAVAVMLVIGLVSLINIYNREEVFNEAGANTGMNGIITAEVVPDEIPEYIVINGERYSTELTELEFDDVSLTNADIEQLKYMVNLQSLTIQNWVNPGNISDINPLAELKNLTSLKLWSNQINDISALAGLTNLTVLDLGYNQINDISVLANLTNLTELILSSTQINDLSALAGLTNLTELILYSTHINDISVLAKLTNLTRLNLIETPVSDLSALADLTHLSILDLGGNQIKDISPLAKLKNLTCLYLQDSQVSDISALADLTNLTWLYLNDNKIRDINVLTELTNLKELYLKRNPLTSGQIEELQEALPNTEIVFEAAVYGCN